MVTRARALPPRGRMVAREPRRGQLTEKAQASLDGKQFRSGMDFPELRSLLVARQAAAPAAPPTPPPPPKERPTPAAGMYVGPALRAMLEGAAGGRKQVEEPAAATAPEKPAPPRPAGPPVMRPAAGMQAQELRLAGQGNLAHVSPVRLYCTP